MRTSELGAVVLAAVVAGGCGFAPPVQPTVRVKAEVMPWADLSAFRTYRWWVPPLVEGNAGYSERERKIDWYIRQAVDRELSVRGYVPDTVGKPDFVVRYAIKVTEDSTSSMSDYLAYRAEGGGKDMGEAFMGYERGTLTVELVDVASRQVAWRGQASAVVENDAKGKRIGPAVQQMMAGVPSRAG
jgi:hypothetical protein